MFFTRLFNVSECKELFTVYDYKNLLKAVEEHIRKEYAWANIEIGDLRVYYNPEHNQGVVCYSNTFEECQISHMEFPYGNDFITVEFN
jgi:hypothetical protein